MRTRVVTLTGGGRLKTFAVWEARHMGKIALLVSREEMLYQAHNILQEKKYQIDEMRVIRSESAVMEARQSIAEGASIIIARGLQASLIKQYTDIPVVEIVLTAQEMALLVTRARQVVKKDQPVIAVVGFKNMFCDMSYFDELYHIELRTYYGKTGMEKELRELALQAVADGADLIIGGDTAVETATGEGVASLFLSMTEDSLKNAFSMAESVAYAMDVEKKSAAQIETLLDYSFNGVIRLDGDGVVLGLNPQMEDMTGRSQKDVKGLLIQEIAPEIGEDVLRRVLREGKEYSLFLELNHTSIFAVLAPVMYDDRVDGAIITCHRMTRNFAGRRAEAEEPREGPLPVLTRFEDILQESAPMQECVRLAKLYALSSQPVVLMGEAGTEVRLMAQSIHNNSPYGKGPFLDVPCDGLSDEEQRETIFGDKGAAVQAGGGTLLIRDADHLTASNQYRLYQMIRFHVCHRQDTGQMRKVEARVMVTVGESLGRLAREGKLRKDLYYLLSGLELRIPPLRERPEDLKRKLDETVRECCDRYGRFHVLTEGARQVLLEYPWEGNLFQIDSFCERLILTAKRRSIDEVWVKKLLRELYGDDEKEGRVQEKGARWEEEACEEARLIARTLKKHGGSREKTAVELGISKATLWRKMKKYEMDL